LPVGMTGAIEDGGNDVAEGVVNDAIAVGSGGNHAGLGFENLGGVVGTGLVGLGLEFGLEAVELVFEGVVKLQDVLLVAFARTENWFLKRSRKARKEGRRKREEGKRAKE
jgi:hypothetical protein